MVKKKNATSLLCSPLKHTLVALLPYLDITDGQTDEQVHEDDADQDGEDEDHGVAGDGVEHFAILVDEVLVLDLSGHHDQGLDDRSRNIHVEALKQKRLIEIRQFIRKLTYFYSIYF